MKTPQARRQNEAKNTFASQTKATNASPMRVASTRPAFPTDAAGILQLQKLYGNRAVTQLISASRQAPIQRFPIHTMYVPDKNYKNESTIDTDQYDFEDLVDILISSKNKRYMETSHEHHQEYVQLANDLGGQGPVAWGNFLRYSPVKARQVQPVLAKFNMDSNLIAAANNYLNVASKDTVDDRVFFEVLKILKINIKGEEGKKYKDLQEGAINKRTNREQKQKEETRRNYMRQGQIYLQIASYFVAEIPGKPEYSDLRLGFLSKLTKIARDIGLHDEQPPEDLDTKKLQDALEEIRNEAKEIVAKVNTGEKKIPLTFEESLPRDYKEQIETIRAEVQKILGPFAAKVSGILKGASIRYRGSLTDGIKNFTKSTDVSSQVINQAEDEQAMNTHAIDFGKKAIPVNINAFDIDAFIEIPEQLWKEWEKAKLIPDKKDQAVKGKLILEKWIPALDKISKEGSETSQKAAAEAIEMVLKFKELEDQVKMELANLKGYKTKETNEGKIADFDLVLQPESKTLKEVEYGKPYPLGELSRSGSAYQELMARFDQLREHELDVMAAWLKEEHVTIADS